MRTWLGLVPLLALASSSVAYAAHGGGSALHAGFASTLPAIAVAALAGLFARTMASPVRYAGAAMLGIGGLVLLVLRGWVGGAPGDLDGEFAATLGLGSVGAAGVLATIGKRTQERLAHPITSVFAFTGLVATALGVQSGFALRGDAPFAPIAVLLVLFVFVRAIASESVEAHRRTAPGFYVPLALGWSLVGLAIAVLAGWILGSRALAGDLTHHPLVPNTAMNFALVGFATSAAVRMRSRRLALFLVPVVATSLLAVIEGIAGIPTGLAVLAPETFELRYRVMAVHTAVAFLVACIALVASLTARRNDLTWPLVWGCGFVVGILGLLVLLGYTLDESMLRAWGTETPMPPLAACGFIVLGIALVTFGWQEGRVSMSRGMRPALIVSLLTIGASTLLWVGLSRFQEEQRDRLNSDAATAVAQALSNFTRVRLKVLEQAALRLETSDVDELERDFRREAQIQLGAFPGLDTVALVDEAGTILYSESLSGGSPLEGRPFVIEPNRGRALDAARAGRIAMTEPVSLRSGKVGAIVVIPIGAGERSRGYLAAGIRLEQLMEAVLGTTATSHAVRVVGGEHVLYERNTSIALSAVEPQQSDTEVYGSHWRAVTWPLPIARSIGTKLPVFVLFAGLLSGTLLAIAIRFAALSRERAEAAERTSAELRREVQAREQTRQALERSRLELQQILESITDAFYLLDRDWRFVYVNERAAHVLRRSRAELIGRSVWDELPPALRSAVELEFRTAAEHGTTAAIETYLPELGAWLETRAYPHETGVAVYFRDVTDRREAFEQLQRNEEMLARTQRIARLGGWEGDVDAGYIWFSDELHRIFGITRETFDNTLQSLFELVHPDDMGRLRTAIRATNRGDDPFDIEFRLRRPDGQERVVHALGQLNIGPEGRRTAVGTAQDITERRRAERRLRHSEAMLARAQRIAHIGSWEVPLDNLADTDANPLHWSEESFRIFGYEPGKVEPESRLFWALVHPDDRAAVRASIDGAILNGTEYSIDHRIVHPDGSVRYVHEEADVIRDRHGKPTRLVGTVQDITERKLAEIALKASEERLRATLEHAPHVAVQWYDADGRVRYWNRASEEIFGWSADDALGRRLDQLMLSPADFAQFVAMLGEIERTGAVVGPNEWIVRRRDGAERMVMSTTFAIPDSLGSHRFVCMDVDVTERHHAEAALRTALDRLQVQEQRFRSLFDYHPDAVVAYDLDGRILFCNEMAERLTGRTRSELVGAPLGISMDDASRELAHAHFRRAVDGSPQHFDAAGRRWDGTAFDIQMSYLPIKVNDEIAGIFAIARDVTAKTRAERERDAALSDLELRNRELQDFAFVASHDLQEPLRKISTFGQRLENQYKHVLGDDGRDFLERMSSAASRMRVLIDDLLSYSRVNTRGQPFAPVSLAQVADEVLSDLEAAIETSGATIDVSPLPTVHADATQMRQLLQNLIGNAIKFRRAESPPRITVGCNRFLRDGADWIRLEIADNGIGFESKYAETIFMPFQRLHGRGSYQGTGIGLAIVRKIVERHGGAVFAESIPGAGTTFVVELPEAGPARPVERAGEPA